MLEFVSVHTAVSRSTMTQSGVRHRDGIPHEWSVGYGLLDTDDDSPGISHQDGERPTPLSKPSFDRVEKISVAPEDVDE